MQEPTTKISHSVFPSGPCSEYMHGSNTSCLEIGTNNNCVHICLRNVYILHGYLLSARVTLNLLLLLLLVLSPHLVRSVIKIGPKLLSVNELCTISRDFIVSPVLGWGLSVMS